ncbi:MAG: CPBP family intramembrane metalloprotease [Deltaproteobacteria bacterium]|nr:CPBP family intramembrane metalloprotease [Deltaproteobacteria bacterium]
MRLAPVITIFAKELRETFRDRRTLFMMIGLPLVLYPALGLVVLFMAERTVDTLAKQPSRVVFTGSGAVDLRSRFADHREIVIVSPKRHDDSNAGRTGPTQTLIDDLKSGGVDVVVKIRDDARSAISRGERVPIDVYSNDARERSALGHRRIEKELLKWDRELRISELARRGQPSTLASPGEIRHTNVATKTEMGGHFAGRVLPILLITMLILGAFYPAIELTAGEKERGTLETLLTAPLTRLEIVTGKYLAVVTLSFASATLNLISLSLTVAHALSQLDATTGSAAFAPRPEGIALILLLIIPAALFVSAVMMVVASFARSFKDAQNLLTPVLLVLIVPASLLGGLPNDGPANWAAFVPILNVVLEARAILEGQIAAASIATVFFASTIYSGAALVFAARLFETETIYFGGREALGEIFARPRAGLVLPPTIASTTLFAIVAFLLLYYVAPAAGRVDPVLSVVVGPVACILVPALALVFLRRFDVRSTFLLRAPNRQAWPATILLGASTWFIAAFALAPLQNEILPVPPSIATELERVLNETLVALGPFKLLALALLPAICEELAFRGLVLQGLRERLRPIPAAIISSLLFGALHLSPYRFAATFLLGLLLAALALRSRSLLPPILVHAAHNALAITFASSAPGAASYTVFAVLFLGGLFFLVWRPKSLPAAPPESARGSAPP